MKFHLYAPIARKKFSETGEFAFIGGISQALMELGHDCETFLLHEIPKRIEADSVVLNICGKHFPTPIAGVPNLVWVTSNPQLLSRGLASAYQHVFTSSFQHFQQISAFRNEAIDYLPQCTDLNVFRPPGPGAKRNIDFFFAGNMRQNFRRRGPETMLSEGWSIEIVGRGWDKLRHPTQPSSEWIDTAALVQRYQNARYVVNDHRSSMKELGFLNNRTFDALACGAKVLSDVPDLPDDLAPFVDTLPGVFTKEVEEALLSQPDRTPDEQKELNKILNRFSTTHAAKVLTDAAKKLLDKKRVYVPPLSGLSRLPTKVGKLSRLEKLDGRLIVIDRADLFDQLKILPELSSDDVQFFSKDSSAKTGTGDLIVHPAHTRLAVSRYPNATPILLLTPDHIAPDAEHGSEFRQLEHLISRWVAAAEMAAYCRETSFSFSMVALNADLQGPVFSAARTICASWPKIGFGEVHAALDSENHWKISWSSGHSHQKFPVTFLEKLISRYREDVFHVAAIGKSDDANSRAASRQYSDHISSLLAIYLRHHFSEDPSIPRDDVEVLFAPKVATTNTPRPLGVFIHVHYPTEIERLKTAVERIQSNKTLYVSVTSDGALPAVQSAFSNLSNTASDFRVFPNRGRDIYPKLWGWDEAYGHHDVVLHLHSKRSAHLGQGLGGQWCDDILSRLLPDPERINTIIAALKNVSKLGMLGPGPFKSRRFGGGWRLNSPLIGFLANRMGLDLNALSDYHLVYPAGSMFWAKTDALQPLLSLELSQSDFPIENQQLDHTIAHAIERLFAISCQAAGFEYLQLANPNVRRKEGELTVADVRTLLSG